MIVSTLTKNGLACLSLVLFIGLIGAPRPLCARQVPLAASAEAAQPVLVELFTSEGCSDCPAADALLARLDATQFISGVHAFVLSEHVTYWNYLGWNDPFSLDAMDRRQEAYGKHFNLQGVYTPQMVVDGAAEFVGSDRSRLSAALLRAAKIGKTPIAIEKVQRSGSIVTFAVRASAPPGTSMVTALAEDGTRSTVVRGENAGRTLHHVAVVRALKEFDAGAADGRSLQLSADLTIGADESTGPPRLVVFLIDRGSGQVLGVAELPLRR